MGPPSLLHPYLQTEKKISCIPPICSYLFLSVTIELVDFPVFVSFVPVQLS